MGRTAGNPHTTRVYRGPHRRPAIEWTLARPETIRASIDAARHRVGALPIAESDAEAEAARLRRLEALLVRAR